MKFSLIPKEEKFFDLFETQADTIVEASKKLKELILDWKVDSPIVKRIIEMEHVADVTTHQIIDKLNRSFITPFDREDIYELASKMDDVIDLIQGTASRMQLYRLERPSEELGKLAVVICQAVEVLKSAVYSLREKKNFNKILEYCVEINGFENDGDHIQEQALHNLFSDHHDPFSVMKWKEIYELAETAIDMCEDVANTLETIVVKQG